MLHVEVFSFLAQSLIGTALDVWFSQRNFLLKNVAVSFLEMCMSHHRSYLFEKLFLLYFVQIFVLCVDFGTPLPPISVKGSIHHVFVHFTAGLIFHLCLSFMIEVQWKIVITSGLIYSCISFYWTKSNEPFKVLIVFLNIAVLVISIVLDSYDVIKISSYY